MYEWLYASIIVFLASFLQAITGFGFAIIGTPLLLMEFGSRDCIQMSLFLSLFIAVILTPKIRHEINHVLLKRLILGSLIGVPLGLLLFACLSLDIIKIIISITVLSITAFLLYRGHKSKKLSSDDSPEKREMDSEHYKLNDQTHAYSLINILRDKERLKELSMGFLAGVFTTSIGMPGVPLVLYFTVRNTKKEEIRSTTLGFFIFVYIISIVMQAFTVKISTSVLITSVILVPATLLGVLMGNLVFDKINQKMFMLIANLLLLYTGIYMLVEQINKFWRALK